MMTNMRGAIPPATKERLQTLLRSSTCIVHAFKRVAPWGNKEDRKTPEQVGRLLGIHRHRINRLVAANGFPPHSWSIYDAWQAALLCPTKITDELTADVIPYYGIAKNKITRFLAQQEPSLDPIWIEIGGQPWCLPDAVANKMHLPRCECIEYADRLSVSSSVNATFVNTNEIRVLFRRTRSPHGMNAISPLGVLQIIELYRAKNSWAKRIWVKMPEDLQEQVLSLTGKPYPNEANKYRPFGGEVIVTTKPKPSQPEEDDRLAEFRHQRRMKERGIYQ